MAAKPTRTASPSRPRGRPLVLIAGAELTGELAQWLLEEGEQRGWRLLDFLLTEGSLAGEPTPVGALVNVLPDDPVVDRLRRLGCPVVRLGRFEHLMDESMPVVLLDYVETGRWAADYFAQRGFRTLAVVAHERMVAATRVQQGLAERAAALGCACHEYLFTNPDGTGAIWTPDAARYEQRTAELTRWLATLPKPVGVVAPNCTIAARVGVMCQRGGVAVPEEVALLAVGNSISHCEMSPVPISAIDLDPRDLVRTGMQVLGKLIARRPVPPRTFVPPRGIITRRSTDILAVADTRVASAVRYIWDHLDTDLSVEDVARATRTPRHTLHRRFRKHLKRGISEELRRARLERFRELLRTTNHTVERLAPQVGFRTATYLTLAFRKTYGLTPRQYRLQARKPGPEGTTDEASAYAPTPPLPPAGSRRDS